MYLFIPAVFFFQNIGTVLTSIKQYYSISQEKISVLDMRERERNRQTEGTLIQVCIISHYSINLELQLGK